MAIDENYLSILLRARKQLCSTERVLNAACLGYPDIIISDAHLDALFGRHNFPVSPRTAEVLRWHRLPDDFGPIYDTESIFAEAGIKITVLDVAQHNGNERIVDLNEPVPPDLRGAFEIIIDPGTLEHCFNVGQAFRNMCEMTTLGGIIICITPMTALNHGFWNFCPTAFMDGLEQNGFKVFYLQGLAKNEGQFAFYDFLPSPYERIGVQSESSLMCVAQKINDRPFAWPVQYKYRKVILS